MRRQAVAAVLLLPAGRDAEKRESDLVGIRSDSLSPARRLVARGWTVGGLGQNIAGWGGEEEVAGPLGREHTTPAACAALRQACGRCRML